MGTYLESELRADLKLGYWYLESELREDLKPANWLGVERGRGVEWQVFFCTKGPTIIADFYLRFIADRLGVGTRL